MVRHIPRGFTLVELLVVITIIVVLISMLAPALDKAIYQAQLVQCAAQLKIPGTGVTAYAMDFRRFYPWRSGCYATTTTAGNAQEAALGAGGVPRIAGIWLLKFIKPTNNGGVGGQNGVEDSIGYDDRILIAPYFPIKVFIDPLVRKIDISLENIPPDSPRDVVGIPYTFWWGWKYKNGGGMTKLGDRMKMFGDNFTVLMSDLEATDRDTDATTAAHPDRDGVTLNLVVQQPLVVVNGFWDQWVSQWMTPTGVGGTRRRGLLDRNTVFADGSVRRHTLGPPPIDTPLEHGDNPMRIMPYDNKSTSASEEPNGALLTGGGWIPVQ